MSVSRRVVVVVALALSLAAPGVSLAGPYGDDLAKCLVQGASSEDKSALVQWMFSMIALHPDVKWMASVSNDQRDKLNRSVAKMFETLLTKTCRTEAKQAVQYEGAATVESSFSVLGQVAARELFSHPSVAAASTELGKYLDAEALKSVLGETKRD